MKKLVSLLLVVALCLGCTSAFAAGKLNVVQENTYFVTKYGSAYYAFAKVENTGDKDIAINAGLLEVYNADGEAISSNDWPTVYGRCLKPGEYTYVSAVAYDGFDDESVVPEDYALTLTGKADKDYTTVRFPAETKLELNVQEDKWNTRNFMYVTVTNTTEETVYDLAVVMALLDAEGNILCVESESLYDSVGLAAGSTLVIRQDIPSDFMDYFEKNSLTPASVDAIVYVDMEADD